MRQISAKLDFVVGDAAVLARMPELPPFRVFDDRALTFLRALAAELFAAGEGRTYPDLAAFAFWCRPSSLLPLREKYGRARLGRGLAFHVAPSNVPLNFAYSLVAALLAGNANAVRLPARDFAQTALMGAALNRLLATGAFADVAARLCLFRYGHEREATDALSAACASRLIWGGDDTVAEIRKSPLPPRANEITFPDRYSICLIHSERYLADYDRQRTAQDFFNDTYLNDQNACTAPRLIFWFGGAAERARAVFWPALRERLERYTLQASQTVDKLAGFYRYAAQAPCRLSLDGDCKIFRVAVPEISPDITNHFQNSGYFYEYDARDLEEILPVCGRKCQTLSYIGFDGAELREFVLAAAPFGVDRIVPVGRTMDFSLVWDGVDLVRTLSREVALP
ncbi:MAG: long-chain-fatty-acyl-CoA reductase [Gracilibacteraceae bacterium]|jgi:hypothetical protein|nr:long-chain-fatty-acyl-CoA reductase [Gracilibacteraceae bacterium]